MQQRDTRFKVKRLGAVAAAVAALVHMAPASAFEIDTGNEDVQMRLDNKISATLGWRVKGADSFVTNPALNSAGVSEYFADSGDLYTTRFDLYSEFDFKYKRDHGIRVSATVWSDPTFPNHVQTNGNPYTPFGPSANPEWPAETKRFYGTSGEFLDAFAFTRVELGETPVNFKLGRTSVVWGEAMFGGVGGGNSIGYAQNPNDGRKASQNPNASLKETSLPISQLHMVANITDTSNLSLYKAFEWRPDRVPASGTYMGFADAVAGAPNLFCAPGPFCLPNGVNGEGDKGDWGIQYKFRPSFYSGNIALVYREFAEKSPWYAAWDPTLNGGLGGARNIYGNDTKLIGLSTNLTAYDISWGAELSYRKNAALNSDFAQYAVFGAGGTNGSTVINEGARGNTFHAVGNMQYFGGKAAFWDTFVVAAEVAYTRLNKVTKNADLYKSVGNGYALMCSGIPAFSVPPLANNTNVAGCSDRDAYALGLFLNPTIYQAITGVDVELPVFIQHTIGNSPLNGGTVDGATTFSAGVKATVNTIYGPQVFQLNYLAFRGKTTNVNPTGANILGAPYHRRDQIQLTYNASF